MRRAAAVQLTMSPGQDWPASTHLAHAQAGRQALHLAAPVAVRRRRRCCGRGAIQAGRVWRIIPALPGLVPALSCARQQPRSGRAAARERSPACGPPHAAASCPSASRCRCRDARHVWLRQAKVVALKSPVLAHRLAQSVLARCSRSQSTGGVWGSGQQVQVPARCGGAVAGGVGLSRGGGALTTPRPACCSLHSFIKIEVAC